MAKKKIFGTITGSNAYKSGIRGGQTILGADFSDEIGKKVKLNIKDERGERWIEFYPKVEMPDILQYKLNKTLYDKDSVSCLNWFNNNAESTILNKK
jgi:hypothetical protein